MIPAHAKQATAVPARAGYALAPDVYIPFDGHLGLAHGAGDYTFSRSDTDATYTWNGKVHQVSGGDAPRFEADSDRLGVLLEKASTNLGLYSEDASNAAWVKTNVTVTANSVAAPDNTTTGDTLAATAGNATFLQTVTAASSTYTGSHYLKRKTGSGDIQLTVDGGTTWTTKTLTTEWQRFDVSQASVTNPQFGIRIVTSGDEVYWWGSQLENYSYPTSYIPTTSAAVTRAAETLHYPVENIPDNDFWGYCIIRPNFDGTENKGVYVPIWGSTVDGGNKTMVYLAQTNADIVIQKRVATVANQASCSPSYSAHDSVAVAWRFSSTDGFKVFAKNLTTGAAVVSGVHANTEDCPLGTTFSFGDEFDGAVHGAFSVKEFNYFNVLVSDAVIEQVLNS